MLWPVFQVKELVNSTWFWWLVMAIFFFLPDTSNFIVHRLEKEGESYLAKESETDLGSSNNGFKWQ